MAQIWILLCYHLRFCHWCWNLFYAQRVRVVISSKDKKNQDFVDNSLTLKCFNCLNLDPFVLQCNVGLDGFVTSVGTCFMRGGWVVISIRRVVIAHKGTRPVREEPFLLGIFKRCWTEVNTWITPKIRDFHHTQKYFRKRRKNSRKELRHDIF